MAEESPSSATSEAAETSWTATCPGCGAKLQPVARACWQCGASLHDADSHGLDYRPTDGDEVRAVSILILAAIGVSLPVLFYWWVLFVLN